MPAQILPVTDLQELTREVLSGHPSRALPCNLSDRWLKLIARDLDAGWPTTDHDEEPSIYTAGPMALVLLLLAGKSETNSGTVTIDELERLLKEFRAEVNLELVSRLSDVKASPATLATIFAGREVQIGQRPESTSSQE